MSAPRIINPATASGGIPVGGSGAAGYVAKWTAATTLGGSTTSGATASLFIDATGNVGVGVTDPGALLEVYGDGAANPGIIRASGNGVGGTSAFQAAKFSTDADGSVFQFIKHRGTRAAPTTVATGDILGSSQYVAYGGTNFRTLSQIVAGVTAYTSDSNISSYLAFSTSPAGSAAGTEKMRIDATGNVGIGTTSPGALLHVNGNQIGGVGASVTPYAQALFGPSSAYTMWWKTGATAGGGLIGAAGPSIYFYVASGTPNAPTLLQVANFDSTGNLILGAATGVSIQAAGSQQGLKLATTPGNIDQNTLDAYREDTVSSGITSSGITNVGTITATRTQIGRANALSIKITSSGGAAMVFSSGWTLTLTSVPQCSEMPLNVISNDSVIGRSPAFVSGAATPTVYGGTAGAFALGINIPLLISGISVL